MTGKIDFRGLPDVASRTLGAAVLASNDDFFADVHNLIAPGRAVHDPTAFGPSGKIYDGWETRRRRSPGTDWAIVRLAAPALVRGVDIDTSWFQGNFPPHASVEGTTLLGYPDAATVAAAEWFTLVDKADIEGNCPNVFAVDGPERLVTHVRLTLHPDGGVARLRVHGEIVPDPRRLGGRTDLAATVAGGVVDSCSNMFFAAPANALAPGVARVMSDGWESARRRDDGNDWLVVRLGTPAVLHEVVVDTSRFIGNAPGWAALTDADTGAELLPRTPLLPDTEHRFRLRAPGTVARARLDILPDGGISRLRLLGAVPADDHAALADRWLSLLPPEVAAAVDPADFFA